MLDDLVEHLVSLVVSAERLEHETAVQRHRAGSRRVEHRVELDEGFLHRALAVRRDAGPETGVAELEGREERAGADGVAQQGERFRPALRDEDPVAGVVQRLRARRRDGVEHGVAGQGVPEGEAVARGGEQTAVDGAAELLRQRPRGDVEQGAEVGERERGEHGQALEGVAGVGLEAGELVVEQGTQARGDDGGELVDRLVAVRGVEAGERLDHRGDVQGVPARALVQGLGDARGTVGREPRQVPDDQPAHRGGIELAQAHVADALQQGELGVGPAPDRVGLRVGLAGGDEQRHPGGQAEAGEAAQGGERRGVGEVEVVEGQQHRAGPGGEPVEQRAAGGGLPRGDRGDAEVGERLGPRRPRRRVDVARAAADGRPAHPRLAAGGAQQRGLADAGLAGDQADRARLGGLEQRADGGELLLPADERGSRLAGRGGGEQPEGEVLDLGARLDVVVVAQRPARGGEDLEGLARAALPVQAGRGDDGEALARAVGGEVGDDELDGLLRAVEVEQGGAHPLDETQAAVDGAHALDLEALAHRCPGERLAAPRRERPSAALEHGVARGVGGEGRGGVVVEAVQVDGVARQVEPVGLADRDDRQPRPLVRGLAPEPADQHLQRAVGPLGEVLGPDLVDQRRHRHGAPARRGDQGQEGAQPPPRPSDLARCALDGDLAEHTDTDIRGRRR